ncbi:MAG: hypothetical protein NC396_08120 [Bacteroides sp.]|nr:hypothetical protein [Bacteroides sp.]MCM1086302.1 hypothetical protein [Bacteroides sp.]
MESVFKFWKNMERKTRELVPVQVFPAVVKDVKAEERTCTVRVNDNVDLYGVRLYAVTDNKLKGFCLIPKKGSGVLVARIANGNDLYVAMFSEVEQVLGTIGENVEVLMDAGQLHYKNDKTEITVKSAELNAKWDGVTFEISGNKVKIKADEIEFNGGNNNGIAKVDEIKKNLESIKKYVEAMNTAISTGLNGVGSSPTASGSAGATAYTGAMAEKTIVINNMEDTKVKH